MSWNPGDDDRDPFDDVVREFERMIEELDTMMGPFGGIHASVHRTGRTRSTGQEVHVDVHDEGDQLRVVADLPGVSSDDIDLSCDGEVLSIRAGNERRSYDERVDLPVAVAEESPNASYNNGVLVVTFEKEGGDGGSTSIEIE